MSKRQAALLKRALEAMGVALADHKHKWTAKERRLYEQAVSAVTKVIG